MITTFGISQALAIGVLQINAGLHKVFGINIGTTTQFIILFCLSSIATFSVVRGIGTGMRRLSELNIILSIILVIILMCIGPARYITNTYLEGIGNYTQNFIGMSLWSDTQKDTEWQNWWTAFYWVWWATWVPFVGMFIAKYHVVVLSDNLLVAYSSYHLSSLFYGWLFLVVLPLKLSKILVIVLKNNKLL